MAKNESPENRERVTTSLWMKRVAKSLGYTGIASIREMMPGLTETISKTREVVSEAKDKLEDTRDKKGVHKLKSFVEIDTDAYLDKVKTLKNNIIEDIRTGNINNKEREDAALGGAFGGDDDFGDFDFDFDDSSFGDDNFDDNFEDGESKPDVVVPNVTVNANINKHNPMVQVMEDTKTSMENISASSSEREYEISSATLGALSSIGSNINSSLETINTNVATIVDFNANTMSSLSKSTISYQESSLSTMGAILVEVKKLTTPQQKEYESKTIASIDDFVDSDGGFDLGAYIGQVGKNIKSYINNSMVGSMLGMVTTDMGGVSMIDSIIANPIGMLLDTIRGSLTPHSLKNVLGKTDKVIGSFAPALIGKLAGMGDSFDMSFGGQVKEAIGKIFGFNAVRKTKLDLSRYDKGPVPFDGMTRKSIVEVIPGYLSRILAAVSKENPLTYDYAQGIFRDVFEMKDRFQEDARRGILYEYDDFDRVRDAIKAEFGGQEGEKVTKKFEDALIKMSELTGIVDPTQDTPNADPHSNIYTLDDIFNDRRSTSNPLIVSNELTPEQLSILKDILMNDDVLTPTMRLKMFAGSNKLSAMESYSKLLRNTESWDPSTAAVIGNKLYDNAKRVTEPVRVDRILPEEGTTEADRRAKLIRDLKYQHRTTIPKQYQDITVDDEIHQILKDNEKYWEERRRVNGTLFREDSRNPIHKILNKTLGPILNPVITRIDKLTDATAEKMHDFIFGLEDDEDTNDPNENNNADETTEGEERRKKKKKKTRATRNLNGDIDDSDRFSSILNTIHDRSKDTFDNFSVYIKDKLFGDKGFFTQIKESDFYKGIVEKKNYIKDYIKTMLFGDDRGPGLLHMIKESAKEAFTRDNTGDGFFSGENGVIASIKSTLRSGRDKVMDFVFDEDQKTRIFNRYNKIKNSDAPVTEAIDYGVDKLKQGFDRAEERIFGPETNEDGSVNEKARNYNAFKSHIREYAPGAVGKGVVGAGIASVLSALIPAGTGLLTGVLLNPIGVAAATIAGTLLSKSDRFNDMMFGEEKDGERIGGLISKKTQDWFKEHKRTIGAGAAIGGGIGTLLTGLGITIGGGLGFIPTMLLGGPVLGAVLGIGTSLTARSEKMQTLLFGEEVDGVRSNGQIDKIKNIIKEKRESGETAELKKKMFKIGSFGVGTVGTMGLFGLIGLNPVVGAFAGIAAGLKLSGDKFQRRLFGDDGGVKDGEETSLGGLLREKFDHILDPIAIQVTKTRDYLNTWFDKSIKEPIVYTTEYLVEGIKGFFEHGAVETKLHRLLREHLAEPIKAGFNAVNEHIIEPIKNSVVGQTFKKYVTDPITTGLNFIGEKIKWAGQQLLLLPLKIAGGLIKGIPWLASMPLRAAGMAVRGVSRIFIDEETRERLDTEHKERLSKIKAEKKERKARTKEFEESLNETSVISRFINKAGGPANENETRKEKKERKKRESAARKAAEKALVTKYGKGYNSLSSVERARIDTEEAQAKDIFSIRDILERMFDMFKNREDEKPEAEIDNSNGENSNPEANGDTNEELKSSIVSEVDKLLDSAFEGLGVSRHKTDNILADINESNENSIDDLMNNINTNRNNPEAQIIDETPSEEERPKPKNKNIFNRIKNAFKRRNDEETPEAIIDEPIIPENIIERTPEEIREMGDSLINNAFDGLGINRADNVLADINRDSGNIIDELTSNNKPKQAEAQIDEDSGTKVNNDGSVDEDSLDPESNPRVAETSKGVGKGLIEALTGKKSPLAPMLGVVKNLGAVVAPFAAKAALIGIAALGVIRLFTNPAEFFKDVVGLVSDVLNALFGRLFNYLESKGFSDTYKSEASGSNVDKHIEAIDASDGELLKNKDYIETVLKPKLDAKLNIDEGIANRDGWDRLKYGDVWNRENNDYNTKRRNAENKAMAEQVLEAYKLGTITLTEEERKKYESYANMSKKDTKVTIGDKVGNFVGKAFDSADLFTIGANGIGKILTGISKWGSKDEVEAQLEKENEYLEDYIGDDDKSGGGRQRAIGEPNVDTNSKYFLHKDEGVLTAKANHLLGSPDTTANIINTFVRENPNATVNDAIGALTSTMKPTATVVTSSNDDIVTELRELIRVLKSPNTNVNATFNDSQINQLTDAMYGQNTDITDLKDYVRELRAETLSASDADYWRYDDSNTEKYGGIAKALFHAVRASNYPSKLISDTLEQSSEDMERIEENVSTENTQSFGSKIKSAVSGAFSKIKSWFSFGGGGDEEEYAEYAYGSGGDEPVKTSKPSTKTSSLNISKKQKTKQKIDIGMDGSSYYKFPSASIPLSDASKSRKTSFGTKPHRGLDLLVRNRKNPLIKSLTGGSVVFAGKSNPDINKSYGNMVQVQDENGMYHLYGHLNSLGVRTGQRITQGAVLGEEGTTGQSSGNHLHYEVGTGINVGKRLTGEVHPAEYIEGYQKGKKVIKATPIEQYESGSYWNGGGSTTNDSSDKITIDSGTTADNVAQSQAEFESVAAMTPEEELNARLENGENILSIMYSPFAELTASLKSFVKGTPAPSSGDEYYMGSSMSGGKLEGGDDAEKIWNYLTRNAGFTKQGAAGIMGNMRAESGLQSNNLENQYNNSTGMSDAQYTAAVDNGSYSGSKFGNDRYGYGLVQWTSEGRKPGLYKMAKERGVSIADLGMQLDYMTQEMESGYPNLVKLAKSPTASLYDVSTEMVKRYEIPAGYNLKSTHDKRAALGQEVYNTYAYGGGGDETPQAEVTSHSYKAHTQQQVVTPTTQNIIQKTDNKVITILTDVVTYLAQIATNTKDTSTKLTSIETQNKKIINNKPTSKETETKEETMETNNPMFDIVNSARKRRKDYVPDMAGYKQAKAIARGF